MKRLLLTVAVAGACALPAMAALEQGKSAPDFKAQASLAGKEFTYSLKDSLKKGPVVVYFYPSAYTGGCNLQAHTFAENMDKFNSAGATVVGVSLDNIQRLNRFSADPDYCAGKLPVVSDADGKIAKSYDLKVRQGPAGLKDTKGDEIGHDFVERTTFVVTPDGKIVNVIETTNGVTPKTNVEKALEVVQQLPKK